MPQYKRLPIQANANGTRSITPKPAAGNRILIYEIFIIPDGTSETTVIIQDTASSPKALMGGPTQPLPLTSDTPLLRPFHHIPCIVTAKGEGLNAVIGAGNVAGHVVFSELPDSPEISE